MKLILPLMFLFIAVSLTRRTFTWRERSAMFVGTMLISAAYFLTWSY
jgi:positive regulator of sigma E activity